MAEDTQQPVIPLERINLMLVSEGHYGPYPGSGKTFAVRNRAVECGAVGDFLLHVHPTPTRRGHEDQELAFTTVDTDASLFMTRQQLETINNDDRTFEERYDAYCIAQGQLRSLGLVVSNSGSSPIESYNIISKTVKDRLNRELVARYTGLGGFVQGGRPEFWVKHSIGDNTYFIEVKSEGRGATTKQRELRLTGTTPVNLDTLFLPYWTGNAYEEEQVRTDVDAFIKGSKSKFFGVASTMWDLKELSKRREYDAHVVMVPQRCAEVLGVPQERAQLGVAISMADLIRNIRETILNMGDISGNERSQVWMNVEKDIQRSCYNGETHDIDEFIRPSVEPLVHEQDYEGARTVQKERYDRIFEVRKLVLDQLIPDWRTGMVAGLEHAYRNFGYIAGWNPADMRFETQVNDRDITEAKLFYRDEPLWTTVAHDQDSGTYGVFFEVPKKLIDKQNPMKAGMELQETVAGYVANIIPPIGGRVFSDSMYQRIAATAAAGKSLR